MKLLHTTHRIQIKNRQLLKLLLGNQPDPDEYLVDVRCVPSEENDIVLLDVVVTQSNDEEEDLEDD